MAVFETPRSRKRRISSSLPSSRETPSDPFGRPSFRPEDLARARPSRGALRDQVALDLGEQREDVWEAQRQAVDRIVQRYRRLGAYYYVRIGLLEPGADAIRVDGAPLDGSARRC